MITITKEYAEIVNECKLNGIMDKVANFHCYADEILTYQITHDNVKHEFNIIADSDFFRDELVSELLESKRVEYFEHAIYLLDGEDWVFSSRKTFNIRALGGVN